MTAAASRRYLVLFRVTHSVVEELKDANEQGNNDAPDEHDKHASHVGNLQSIGLTILAAILHTLTPTVLLLPPSRIKRFQHSVLL